MSAHKFSPSITEDEETIEDAIREFLGRIGYDRDEEREEEEESENY